MPERLPRLEIVPEPTDEERAAVEAAFAALASRRTASPSAWWESGIREGVGDGDAEESDSAGRPG